MSKYLNIKFFAVVGLLVSSSFANVSAADNTDGDEITSQWKGGKVTVRDPEGAIIDVFPGYLNVALGRNCVLAHESDARKAVLNECPSPGYTKFTTNKAVYLNIEVVPGNPGLCLADPAEGPSGSVVIKACDSKDRDQQWQYLYSQLRPGRGIGGCLTANGMDKEVTLTECKGFSSQSWQLP